MLLSHNNNSDDLQTVYILLTNLAGNCLQVVYRYWERNDVKGVIGAMEKMADHAVRIFCGLS